MAKISPGMIVVRGPSWSWDNQDGKSSGVVRHLDHVVDDTEWWKVDWKCGSSNLYRVGGGYQDIVPSEIDRKRKENSEKCKCNGPTKMIEMMNTKIAICSNCKKRK